MDLELYEKKSRSSSDGAEIKGNVELVHRQGEKGSTPYDK